MAAIEKTLADGALAAGAKCPNGAGDGACGGTLIYQNAMDRGTRELVCSLCSRGRDLTPESTPTPTVRGITRFRYVGVHKRLIGRVVDARMEGDLKFHERARYDFPCIWSCRGFMRPTNQHQQRPVRHPELRRYACDRYDGHRIWLNVEAFVWME